MRTVVVLPAPLGPSSPKTVPASTENDRPSSARVPPRYVFTSSLATMAGALAAVVVIITSPKSLSH